MERTLLITALITASLVGFGFWLCWQRTKRRNDAGFSEHFSRTSDTVAERTITQSADMGTPVGRPDADSAAGQKATDHAAPLQPSTGFLTENHLASEEIGRPSESRTEERPLATLGSDSGKDAKGETGVNDRANSFSQTLREPAGEVQKNAGPQIPQDAQDGAGGPEEQHLIPDTGIAPDRASTAHSAKHASVEAANISHQASCEQHTVSASEATLGVGHESHTGKTPPEREAARTVHQSPSDGLTPADAVVASVSLPQRPAGLVDEETQKAPKRYRPPPQRPPRPATQQSSDRASGPDRPSEVPLDICVRLTFDRFGFCEIGFLPARTSELNLDNEISVKLRGTSLCLLAQEDWYQDIKFENIAELLRQGFELKGRLADDRRVRWLLTGRDLYVLASNQRASGFISTNRLALGRSHVVLCVVELLQQVETILNEAGCKGYSRLDESFGVPRGWVALREVSPTEAITLNPGSDPFYAIKHAPDIEIELAGGVCLHNSVWLAGYPPQIRLLGQQNGVVKVLIDGKEAQHTTEGFLIADGYDGSGQQHSVYCEGLSCSCSYSIEEPPDSWQEWRAYRFGQADICGPLVRPVAAATNKRPFTVPMSNPLLLGTEPGQIFRCSARSVAHWKGFVPFDVVWALPAYPLMCDKKTARILQFAPAPVSSPKNHTKAVLDWCKAILDASRKGLRVGSDSVEAATRWGEYKKAARKIWRAVR